MDALHEIAVMPHLWIIPIAVAALTGFGFLWWFGFAKWFPGKYSREYPSERFPWSGWSVIAIFWWVFAGVALLTWVLLLMPYQSKYHVLYQVSGSVESVTNAFISGSGDLTPYPVVRLDTLDRPVAVGDPRVMDLSGEDVTLLCSIEWVPYAMDRINCSIADIK